MGGSFRQLAEKALHPAPQLRPVALASYGREPRRDASKEQVWPETTHGMRTADHDQAETSSQQQSHMPSKQPRAVGRPPALMAADQEEPQADARPFSQHPQDDAQTQLTRDHARPQRHKEHRTAQESAQGHQRDHLGATLPTPSSSLRPSISRQDHTSSPLRPISVLASRPAVPQARSEANAQARREAEAAPEVHIHIGRIELTAVTPPPASKRESAATKKPMSLEEYLQRQSRRAP
ncbi:MAG: hypothetical protein CAF41_000495 [Nitrospira sp. CG24A]|nr:MAG: hypothetical protein CAF41_000495 [Nitrospira sp. CG24A]